MKYDVKIFFGKNVVEDNSNSITWEVSDTKQLSVKPEGITLYDENGGFVAFYYADKVIGVEVTPVAEEEDDEDEYNNRLC